MLTMSTNECFCNAVIIRLCGVDTVYSKYVVCYVWICTMTTQLMSVIYPIAVAMERIITWVMVCTPAYFTCSVWHNHPPSSMLNFSAIPSII